MIGKPRTASKIIRDLRNKPPSQALSEEAATKLEHLSRRLRRLEAKGQGEPTGEMNKNVFQPYIPSFMDVDPPAAFQFDTVGNLLANKILQRWAHDKVFSHFVVVSNAVMAVMHDGKRWCVGHVTDPTNIVFPPPGDPAYPPESQRRGTEPWIRIRLSVDNERKDK